MAVTVVPGSNVVLLTAAADAMPWDDFYCKSIRLVDALGVASEGWIIDDADGQVIFRSYTAATGVYVEETLRETHFKNGFVVDTIPGSGVIYVYYDMERN